MNKLLDIVHEDEGLLVVNKPADLVCHPTKTDAYSSLIGRVRLHLGDSARPHLINRLDRETSGLVVIGKQDAMALLLRRLWEAGEVRKEYLAIVEGAVVQEAGVVDAPLGPHRASKVVIRNEVREDGASSITEFRCLHRFVRQGEVFSLLQVRPKTGRKHQIRIHLAHLGHPLVGDKIYGADEQIYLDFVRGCLSEEQGRTLRLPNQALHAGCLSYSLDGSRVRFFSPPPSEFLNFVSGGDPSPAVDVASWMATYGPERLPGSRVRDNGGGCPD